LTEAGQPPQTAKTAEELIRKNSGWTIPVTQLAFWVRGLPDPNSKVTRFMPNAQGLIGELEQLGWKVTYGDYLNVATATNNIAMPGRIVAEYKDVRLTLVVREWLFETEAKL
jgi:outer membrane lipoprotein LolB